MLRQDIDYFQRGLYENPLFWTRLGGKPNFKDTTVVDLGCGHGSLCIDIAMSGARKVIGLDLDQRRIEFTNENLRCSYPILVSSIQFRSQNLEDAPDNNIDFFVSKDTFEHVVNLKNVLHLLKNRLKVGGRIYTGFGPLWNSPFGDHNRLKMRFPWGHLLFNEEFLIHRLNRVYKKDICSIYELGINKLVHNGINKPLLI